MLKSLGIWDNQENVHFSKQYSEGCNSSIWKFTCYAEKYCHDPQEQWTFIIQIHHSLDLKSLTRLWLGLSHLNEYRFKNNFKNCIDPLYTCSFKAEPTKHFFLRCYYHSGLRIFFLNDLNNISPQFALFPEDVFVKTPLYGNPIFHKNDNQEILEASIRYILDSKRFSGAL